MRQCILIINTQETSKTSTVAMDSNVTWQCYQLVVDEREIRLVRKATNG